MLTPCSAEEIAALDLGISQFNRAGLSIEAKALEGIRDKILALLPSSHVARIEPDADALLEAQGFVARPGPKPRVDEKIASDVAEAIKAYDKAISLDPAHYESRLARAGLNRLGIAADDHSITAT